MQYAIVICTVVRPIFAVATQAVCKQAYSRKLLRLVIHGSSNLARQRSRRKHRRLSSRTHGAAGLGATMTRVRRARSYVLLMTSRSAQPGYLQVVNQG